MDDQEKEKPILNYMVGLPRSGKTTEINTVIKQERPDVVVVSADSVRLALHGQRFHSDAEPHVHAVVHTMVKSLFLAGNMFVVIDETNITRRHRMKWIEMAHDNGWDVGGRVIRTSKEECLRRAREENDEVIIPVIERMAAEADFFDLDSIDLAEETHAFDLLD